MLCQLTGVLVLLSLLVPAQGQANAILDDLYYGDNSNEADTPQKNKCKGIQADLNGCFGCYPCDDPRLNPNREITRLSISNGQCTKSEFCCVPQTSFSTRTRGKCGDSNPEGVPRSVRDSLRAVLPGEYPWRAWVYSSQSSKPLCAATYIREDARAFITTASCIRNQAGALHVRFTRDGPACNVDKTFIHPGPGSDLALLVVTSLAAQPTWIVPACMPEELLRFGTTCLAVSEDDNFLYTAVPKPSVCEARALVSGPEVLCSLAPAGDYRPAPGSALVCLDHNAKTAKHVAYGIALDSTDDGFTRYTNVTHFGDWVDSQIDNLYPKTTNRHGYHG